MPPNKHNSTMAGLIFSPFDAASGREVLFGHPQ